MATRYVYNGIFYGDILVVGRTGCGKTRFVQKLVVNIFWGDLVKAEWVSCIKLDKRREAEIQSCFGYELEFHYPKNKEHFENLLHDFKIKSSKSGESSDTYSADDNGDGTCAESTKRDRLIVMVDVSGLADTSQKFASFPTVARKFRNHCVYIFHAIHPEKGIWKTILSQTNILNIFPASVPLSTVKKILEANCIRRTNKYIPVNSLWITKLFIQLANNEEKTCLTLDCTGFNPNSPGHFRIGAEDPNSQTCFFNKADEDHMFNVFVSKRIKKEDSPDKILFEIESVKSQTNNETYSATSGLENLTGNGLSNVTNAEPTVEFSDFADGKLTGKIRRGWKSAKPKFPPGR